jgi:GH43 family beta-xylosidase
MSDQEVLQQDNGLYLMWSGASDVGHNLIFVAPMSNTWTLSGAPDSWTSDMGFGSAGK